MSSTDRDKLAAELREELLAVLPSIINKIVDRVYPPVDASPETPAPTDPVKAPVSRKVLAGDSDEWAGGVSKQQKRFLLKHAEEDEKVVVPGATVSFADGSKRKITNVSISYGNFIVHVDGDILLDPAKVGYPNVVLISAPEVAAPSQPDTQPGPVIIPDPLPVDPTDPEIVLPEPETPFQPFTLQINNYDGKPYWENGVWVMDANANRVSIPKETKALDAFSVGSKAKLVDGLVRTVLQCQDVGKDLSVVLSGPPLDPAKVGYPFSISSAPDDAVDDAPVDIPEPSPIEPPVPPVVPGTYRGKVAVNNGLGMGHEQVVPGTHMQHYRWPQLSEWEKAADSGFTRARVGGLWERMKLGGAGKGKGRLNNEEMDRMLKVCEFAKQVDMDILWDMHNYSGYSATGTATNSARKRIGTPEVPVEALGDDWHLILSYLCKESVFNAATYGYDIMNEPIIPWATWKPAAQHSVNRIAEVSDKVVVIEGIHYSNTTNWVTNNPGMETITHPRGKQFLEFHGHLYLDKGQDGFWTNPDETNGVVDVNIGLQRIAKFAAWGKQHGLKLGIGETMVPGIYPQYVAALDKMLEFCVSNGIDVYLFFTAHGAGSNWHNIYKPENAPTLKVIEKYSKPQRKA